MSMEPHSRQRGALLTDNAAPLRVGANAAVNLYFDSTFAIGSSPPSRAAMASFQAVSSG
jgi:hypothetical protein